ncbi:MAG: histidine kinase [Ruminococcus sp.]|nr:histidine kinase [Ruminococcus sp.]
MDNFEALVSMLDYALNTKSKRHIAGGILLSISFLFGGLAVTAMTIKGGSDDE